MVIGNNTQSTKVLKDSQDGLSVESQLQEANTKISAYRVERKDLQKSIIYLLQKISEVLRQNQKSNLKLLRELRLMFRGVMQGNAYNIEELPITNSVEQLNSVFAFSQKVLLTNKINFQKIREKELTDLQDPSAEISLKKSLAASLADITAEFAKVKKTNLNVSLNLSSIQNESFDSQQQQSARNSFMRRESMSGSKIFRRMNTITEGSSIKNSSFTMDGSFLDKSQSILEESGDINRNLKEVFGQMVDQENEVDIKIMRERIKTKKISNEINRLRMQIKDKKGVLNDIQSEKEGLICNRDDTRNVLQGKLTISMKLTSRN